MADNNTAGGLDRYRKLSGVGVSERLFSWGKVQSEIISAENEYLETVGSLSSANKNIDQLKREIASLTAKYERTSAESAQLAKKLAEETAAHQLLICNYEANSTSWAEDGIVKESALHHQQAELAAKEHEINRLETLLAENTAGLAEKISKYNALASEYTGLVHEKNVCLSRLSSSEETVSRLTYTHKKEIEDLNRDFEEKSRLFVPTIHELTRTVDSWKYQRECDLTEIHQLKTDLAARNEEIVHLRKELDHLQDIRKQMLTDINRMGFATVKADSESRTRQEQLKEEQTKLAREISNLEQTKHSLESDLSEKQQTLSTYSAITSEITNEWKKHPERTKASITKAAGTVPTDQKYGFLAQISGHRVAFASFTPASYEELRNTDTLVREAAKKLAASLDTVNCRKEAFVVVPDECMMYISTTLYASPACSVQVITPSQVLAATRTVARFVVYEKTQIR